MPSNQTLAASNIMDYRIYLLGLATSLFPFCSTAATPERVSAIEYDRLWSLNQIAAEHRFLGREVIVEGTALKVSRDPSGRYPLIFLRGSTKSTIVISLFAQSQELRAANVGIGSTVKIQCKSGQRVEISSILIRCLFVLPNITFRMWDETPGQEEARTWTRKQLLAWFRCREDWGNDEEQAEGYAIALKWFMNHGGDVRAQDQAVAFVAQLQRELECPMP